MSLKPKILIVGSFSWYHYEQAFLETLLELDYEVESFKTKRFFNSFFGKVQLAIPFPGVAFIRLNYDLLKYIEKSRPTSIIFWRPTHISPFILKLIKKKKIKIISYNNDDPFRKKLNKLAPWYYNITWIMYRACIKHFDFNFFYRKVNVIESQKYDSKYSDILQPYFIPNKDKPYNLSKNEKKKFEVDVLFIGHYENDGRKESLLKLINNGINIKIWGPTEVWNKNEIGEELFKSIGLVKPLLGEDYSKALSGAKICLAFLSKLNRDTYTRRCFEIPACGSLLLAERTDDLKNLFKENEEACFFSNNEELLKSVKWLLNNPEIREKIAFSGMKRVINDGHDIRSRVKSFIKKVKI